MKHLKKFNESNKSEKELWWDNNWKKLFKIVEDFQEEQFDTYFGDDAEMIMGFNTKSQAEALLDECSIEELDEMIETYGEDFFED